MTEFEVNKHARMLARDLISDCSSFKSIADVLVDNEESLITIDPTFAVELAYVKQAEGALQTAVRAHVLKFLPNATKRSSIYQAHAEAKAFLQADMVLRANNGTKGQVKAVVEMLANMQRSGPRGLTEVHSASLPGSCCMCLVLLL